MLTKIGHSYFTQSWYKIFLFDIKKKNIKPTKS